MEKSLESLLETAEAAKNGEEWLHIEGGTKAASRVLAALASVTSQYREFFSLIAAAILSAITASDEERETMVKLIVRVGDLILEDIKRKGGEAKNDANQ